MNQLASDAAVSAQANDPYFLATPEARPFWDAAAEGRLLVKTCLTCQRPHWYPRSVCPLCGSGDTDWAEASGKGSIFAFTEQARANPPYVVAYVKLAEGPMMLTNLVDMPAHALAIDAPVSVRFMQAPEGRMVPVFGPAA